MKQMIYHFEKGNLNQLEYWFDGIKITGTTDAQKLTNLKIKFQEVFRKTNPAGDNIVFEKIWANIGTPGNNGLRQSLFPETIGLNSTDLANVRPSILVKFQNIVSNTINPFYNFIKVK